MVPGILRVFMFVQELGTIKASLGTTSFLPVLYMQILDICVLRALHSDFGWDLLPSYGCIGSV